MPKEYITPTHFTLEIDGVTYKATYVVTGRRLEETITVSTQKDPKGKGTQLGRSEPDALAKSILQEMIRENRY